MKNKHSKPHIGAAPISPAWKAGTFADMLMEQNFNSFRN